jgi:gentisate 1,2-dioxygenase
LQLIMGGEVEGSHRHTAAALRLVIEGTGAYTATDGERIWMRRGDVITTPSWTWHDHGKESEGPMIWLDGIDVPIVNFLQTTFYEELEGEDPRQPLFRPDGDSTFRYGSGLLPLNAVPTKRYSPVYCYPYERTLEVLDGLNRAQEWDPHHGLKMRLANPLTGGHFLPTIAGFVQQLPKGFSTSPYRATDAAIYTVLQGSGTVTMGSETFAFAENDTFVAPNWTPISFSASDEVVLFSFSDRALQEHMGVYREQPVS